MRFANRFNTEEQLDNAVIEFSSWHAIVNGLELYRSGGRAIGGRVVGRYRAPEPQRCGCCRCRVRRGELVYEVLVDDDVLEVCSDCAGPAAW